MKRHLIAILVGFVLINILSALTAILVLQPNVNSLLQPHIRSSEEGLNFLALTLGYFVVTVGLTYILTNSKPGKSWVQRSLSAGLAVGLSVCLGDHLVTAGWSKLHMGAMAFSGLIDTIPVVVASLAIGFILRKDLV